jgi:hypothetical protein
MRSPFHLPGSFLAKSLLLAAFLGAASLLGNSPVHSSENAMSLTKAEIEIASKRRVVFAHQSVGENILDGVRALAKEQGVALNIVEGRRASGSEPGIFHFKVGENGDPSGKIGDYAKTLSAAPFGQADVALVKLCYVDFNQQSDAASLAKTYVSAIRRLEQTYPSTRFVAVTAPLTAIPGGPKAWVKKMIGRTAPDLVDNAKRKEFNDLLRREFDRKHLLDIASLEAETTTGEDGKPIEAMRRELTDDGGHLNGEGQRVVGAAFIKILALQ